MTNLEEQITMFYYLGFEHLYSVLSGADSGPELANPSSAAFFEFGEDELGDFL